MSAPTHYCLRCYNQLNNAAVTANAPAAEVRCPHCGLPFDPQDEQTFVSFDVLSPWAAYLLAFLVLLFGSGFILGSLGDSLGGGLPGEFASMDKNGDGQITPGELPPGESEKLFREFDVTEDKALDALELEQYLVSEGIGGGSANRQKVGWSLVFGLPICMGAVLGYATSPRRFKLWQKVIFGILLFCGFLVIVGLLSTLAPFGGLGGVTMGMFCIVMLGLVFILPFMLGDWLGYALRRRDERKKRNWKWVKVVILLLLPFGLDAAERLVPRDEDLATVATQAVFPVSRGQAWNSVVFYEQIEHEPPFLLRLALPRPVGTTGGKAAVGDTCRCEYENGYLVKKITEREEGRVLGFRVIRQEIHFEHDLELREGSFRVEPGPEPGTALVTLTTTYRRLTYPAFIWQPAETLVLHTLHRHVLDGMRANAEREIAAGPGPDAPGPVGRLELPAAAGH